MRKFTIVTGIILGSLTAIGALASWAVRNIEIERIEYEDETDDEDGVFDRFRIETPQNMETFRRPLNEHEEAVEVDKIENVLPVNLHMIHLGDLSIPCPGCGTEVDMIGLGLGTAEDRISGEGEFNNLQSMGVVVYPCGHTFYSMCLTDKVANILNAEEVGRLSPGLFEDLVHCDEHGE